MPQRQQPPIRMDADKAKQIGYKAGQHIEQKGLSHHDIVQIANQQYANDGIPITLFSWYKDGFVEGYRSQEQ